MLFVATGVENGNVPLAPMLNVLVPLSVRVNDAPLLSPVTVTSMVCWVATGVVPPPVLPPPLPPPPPPHPNSVLLTINVETIRDCLMMLCIN